MTGSTIQRICSGGRNSRLNITVISPPPGVYRLKRGKFAYSLLDHHRPNSIPELDETPAIEPEQGLQHVRKHMDVEEPVAVA